VKIEFHRSDEPDDVLVVAIWQDGRVIVESEDETRRDRVARAFRRTPVVVDDGAYRRLGTSGEVLIQPGSLEWFRAVVQTRAQTETGLVARFVPGTVRGGYDPAADYRSFEDSIERLTS
jgi:hypothetical protein